MAPVNEIERIDNLNLNARCEVKPNADHFEIHVGTYELVWGNKAAFPCKRRKTVHAEDHYTRFRSLSYTTTLSRYNKMHGDPMFSAIVNGMTDTHCDTPTGTINMADVFPKFIDASIAEAALEAVTTGSIMPLVKEELKCTIQRKRLASGQNELETETKLPRCEKLSEEDELKRKNRRERNKVAAAKCRMKKKNEACDLKKESMELETRNSELTFQIKSLEEEKLKLEALLTAHLPHCLTQLKDIVQTQGAESPVTHPMIVPPTSYQSKSDDIEDTQVLEEDFLVEEIVLDDLILEI
ncbi:unnamed protein product [Owenia fusiformis]|uniref:BZIP domain-containing protein n=1 Tax=Owenia fusiformis TaxID=6347 RepID=A0A8S4PGT2_OWEFU|nr:unnamed protein product [Owenia fusiformis]